MRSGQCFVNGALWRKLWRVLPVWLGMACLCGCSTPVGVTRLGEQLTAMDQARAEGDFKKVADLAHIVARSAGCADIALESFRTRLFEIENIGTLNYFHPHLDSQPAPKGRDARITSQLLKQ